MAKNQARFNDSGRLLFWDSFAQDVKFACRLFVRTPLLTAAIVATLALGAAHGRRVRRHGGVPL